jgi:hypothetical protein
MALPKSEQQAPEWQVAAEALLMAAEDRGPLMHAHVGMMLALQGAKPIPEYDSSKERHWGWRKLKRSNDDRLDLMSTQIRKLATATTSKCSPIGMLRTNGSRTTIRGRCFWI